MIVPQVRKKRHALACSRLIRRRDGCGGKLGAQQHTRARRVYIQDVRQRRLVPSCTLLRGDSSACTVAIEILIKIHIK